MDIFLDDEPDLMGQELVREFNNLTNKFYSIFDDDLIESDEGSEIYPGIKSEVSTEEVYIAQYYSHSDFGLNKDTRARNNRRKVELTPLSIKRHPDNDNEYPIGGVEKGSLADVIVDDTNVKVVSQLPTNIRKQDIKVRTQDDNAVTISYLNYEGKRFTQTAYIPYDIDLETSRATYRNGILEIIFNRK